MVADIEVDIWTRWTVWWPTWWLSKKKKKVSNMELDMVADMEVDKVVDMEVDMVADIEVDMVADIDINMEINLVRVDHRGWLIGPELFRPEAYPACAYPKL